MTNAENDLEGRRFLVTGANSGLGLATSEALARRGGHVIMAVRDLGRGAAARDGLLAKLPGARLELRELDLLRLASVRALADQDLAVDVLINNAGVMMAPRELGEGGWLAQYAANHLGHFLLTRLLLPGMHGRADPRVVTVTSGFIKRSKGLDLDDLDGRRGYSPGRAYVGSKLANALFALELDRRLRARGSRVRSVLAHPGYAATPGHRKGSGLVMVLSRIFSALFARPVEDGARSLVHAATAAEVEGGQTIGPRKGSYDPAPETPGAAALDREAARRLWSLSERVAGLPADL